MIWRTSHTHEAGLRTTSLVSGVANTTLAWWVTAGSLHWAGVYPAARVETAFTTALEPGPNLSRQCRGREGKSIARPFPGSPQEGTQR